MSFPIPPQIQCLVVKTNVPSSSSFLFQKTFLPFNFSCYSREGKTRRRLPIFTPPALTFLDSFLAACMTRLIEFLLFSPLLALSYSSYTRNIDQRGEFSKVTPQEKERNCLYAFVRT